MTLMVPYHNDRPEHRVRVLASVAGTNQPHVCYLDVTDEDFEKLPTSKEVLEGE